MAGYGDSSHCLRGGDGDEAGLPGTRSYAVWTLGAPVPMAVGWDVGIIGCRSDNSKDWSNYMEMLSASVIGKYIGLSRLLIIINTLLLLSSHYSQT